MLFCCMCASIVSMGSMLGFGKLDSGLHAVCKEFVVSFHRHGFHNALELGAVVGVVVGHPCAAKTLVPAFL